jgi:hypothetical protein
MLIEHLLYTYNTLGQQGFNLEVTAFLCGILIRQEVKQTQILIILHGTGSARVQKLDSQKYKKVLENTEDVRKYQSKLWQG